MKLFHIYIKKSSDQSIDDLTMIKNGFSFFAFLFNFLWFLQHKMWRESLAFVLVSIVFGFIFQKSWLSSFDIFIIQSSLMVMIGLNANYWYEQNLLKKDYQFVGCVYGKNEDEAKLKFISNCFDDKSEANIFSSSIFNLQKSQKPQEYFSV